MHLRQAVVLCFHDIVTGSRVGRYGITLDHFSAILDELRDYRVVTLKDWVDGRESQDTRPRVVLTFDDGYTAHRELVLPELLRRKMGATFFFYADQLKRDKKWSALAKENPHGLDFGSHSWSHTLMREVNDNTLFKELYLARTYMDEALGRRIESFAWPFGYYTDSGVLAAKSAGFAYQVSVDYRIATRDDILKTIPRFTVYGKKPVEQVRGILAELRVKTQGR